MGILDKWFAHKEQTQLEDKEVPETDSVSQEIENILLILGNLGVMRDELIRQHTQDKEYFNENILIKLGIQEPVGLDYINKYFEKARFGYGSSKIRQLREKYQAVASEKLMAGMGKKEVVDLLISIAKNDIIAYEDILRRFNESLKQVEETAKDYNDQMNMIDYWKEYYKEQELGYPVSLDKKVESLKQELINLPYGGYGQVELNKFETSAKKMIEEARLSGEDSHHTISRIVSDIFNPMKNRLLGDADRLQKRIQMIEESPYISNFEKEKNKQRIVQEFKQMNGHVNQEEEFNLDQFKKNLTQLEMGGYGEDVINNFSRKVDTIIADGKRVMKPEIEVQRDIREEYQKLLNAYEAKLKALKEKLNEIEEDTIPEPEKEMKKNIAIEEFHDDVGLPIDYEERIIAMSKELESLERGGYGELKVSEFKTNAFERLESASTRVEVRDALREVRDIQTHMIQTYKEALRRLSDSIERATHDRHLTEEEKEKAIEEYTRDFKFNMGYRMNFEKYVDNRAEELATLEQGGYGKEAVDEFRREAKNVLEMSESDQEKYEKIRQKFNALKKQYLRNVKVFQEWKRLQLKNAKEGEKDTLEKDLNVKISYMLSLSPNALYEYYIEDDRKKREAAEKHNRLVACKYLARKEATYLKDESIYQKRLEEFENGKEPYSKEELDDAEKELEIISLTEEYMSEDERIISIMEYIDSTLLRQMMYVEASLMKLNR